MPYEGAANSIDGQNTILSVVGPMRTSIGSLKLLFKAILSQEPWFHDPLVLAMPWSDDIEMQTQRLIKASVKDPSLLTFAIMRHDSVVQPHSPVRQALMLIKQTEESWSSGRHDWVATLLQS